MRASPTVTIEPVTRTPAPAGGAVRLGQRDRLVESVRQPRCDTDPVGAEDVHRECAERVGRQRARRRALRHDHLVEYRLQRCQHSVRVLVVQHRDDGDQPREREVGDERLCQSPGPGRVVRRVQQHRRTTADHLEPARRRRGSEPHPHRVEVELLPTVAEQRLDGSQRHRGVVGLVRSQQRHQHVRVRPGQAAQLEQLAPDRQRSGEHAELEPFAGDRRADLGHAAQQDLGRGHLLPGQDGEAAGLDDPGLLPRDLLDRVAQVGLVVQPDRGDHRDGRVHDVRRVPRAAHAHLDHRDVDGRVGEHGVRERGERLEVRQRVLVPGVDQVEVGLDLGERGDEAVVGERLAVQADPLGHPLQVRTGVAADPQTQLAQEGVGHPGRGRLAVGAGHQQHRVRRLRAAQDVEQVPDAIQRGVQSGLGPAPGERRLHLGQRALGHGRRV